MKKTEIALVVENQLDPAKVAGFQSCGNAFADSEITADSSIYNHVRLLGDNPSFEDWETGRVEWSKGYSASKGYKLDDDATVKAWSRFASRIEKNFGMTKPKKTDNKDSVKKAESREKAKETLDSLKEKSFEELNEEITALLAKPSLDNVKKTQPLLKAIEEKRKDLAKDNMEAIKQYQKEITALIKKCIDEKQLQAIYAILNDMDYQVATI